MVLHFLRDRFGRQADAGSPCTSSPLPSPVRPTATDCPEPTEPKKEASSTPATTFEACEGLWDCGANGNEQWMRRDAQAKVAGSPFGDRFSFPMGNEFGCNRLPDKAEPLRVTSSSPHRASAMALHCLDSFVHHNGSRWSYKCAPAVVK